MGESWVRDPTLELRDALQFSWLSLWVKMLSAHALLPYFRLFAARSLSRLSLLIGAVWLLHPLCSANLKAWFSQEPIITGTHLHFITEFKLSWSVKNLVLPGLPNSLLTHLLPLSSRVIFLKCKYPSPVTTGHSPSYTTWSSSSAVKRQEHGDQRFGF